MKHPQTNLQFIDLTLPIPEQNLAFDEALLEACEEGCMGEVLRFWEPEDYFVVLGYSGKVHSEVHLSACKQKGVPVLRRVSGGGTVLQGPGCLNFSLILHINGSKPLQNLTETNAYILEAHRSAVQSLVNARVDVLGISDLTADGLKFSGNAQRRKRRALLFHGTFLTHFDLKRMEEFLPVPKKQPPYRKDRPHQNFVTNLNVSSAQIKEALQKKWAAGKELKYSLEKQVGGLVQTRYGKKEWNYKFE